MVARAGASFRERVVSRGGGDEVSGDDLRALMNELVEGVLAVGSCCTPDDWL